MLKQHRDPEEEIRTAVPGNVKILVLDIVVFELERLARKASASTHAFASASLDFFEKRRIPVIEHKPGPTDVDAALLAHASRAASTDVDAALLACALTEK